MEILVKGRRLMINRSLSNNKNATARMRDGALFITLPSRWSIHEREKIGDRLQKRAIKAIENGRWSIDSNSKVIFSHGQHIMILGKVFEIAVVPGRKFGSRIRENRIEIKTDESHPKREQKISAIAKRRLAEAVMPKLTERVKSINEQHFGSKISGVFVRDTISRWGSCSSLGNISLSFRLLFMPDDIIDYVIVHELAHTKHRNHGKRFWALVEKVVPDHREKRAWLRNNGQSYPKPMSPYETLRPGQQKLDEFYDEPY